MRDKYRSYPCGGRGPWIAGRMGRGIFFGLGFALLFGLFVKMLWNWLAPGLFGLGPIHYWQAVGLLVLARILFGHRGMRFGGGWHGHGHFGWGGPCSGEEAADGHIKNWRKYDQWWEEEGREAFRKYTESQGK